MVDIPMVQLDPELPIPERARSGDAGIDLLARAGVILRSQGGRALVATGIAVELPGGLAGLVLPRSGLALRHGVTCLNAPGLIDPGYRGEIGVILVNTDPTRDYEVCRGDRIAQLILVRFEDALLVAAGSLGESERGAGGFGHTGI
ncbi:MAG: dUTP diphosphatase [Actinomycetota bacterium]|nr:dUTP diphosphatase [Actinomycetota bacterium]